MAAHVGCSVLSSDEEACCLLAGCPAFPAAALTILKKYPGRQDIVVRITYCLGNGGSTDSIRFEKTSVQDPDPSVPHVFGPQAKKVRKTLIPTVL